MNTVERMRSRSIGEWLNGSGLEHLEDVLAKNGIRAVGDVYDLNESDFSEMGVLIGDRKKILAMVSADEDIALSAEIAPSKRVVKLIDGAIILFALVYVSFVFIDGEPADLYLLIGVCGIWIYLLPTRISFNHGHQFRWLIALINVFFGYTGIAWIILLIVALRGRRA